MVVTRKTPKKATTRSVTRAAKQEKAAAEAAATTKVDYNVTYSSGVEADGDVIMTPQVEFAPLNLNTVIKRFKNPHYRPPRKFKNVKQMLVAERRENMPLDIPTYSNIEAPPSIIPQKKYCDITGLEAKYTDPKTRLRYHSAEVYKEIKQLAPGVVQDYLGLRHAAVVLR
ncbi:5599_t:CDS:2 [Diversispora eburnea]|uniref:5599_t:CDS:1 n=1 Tax=Diversispora eburnea TaxID=1213867 RepID=A0A9N8VC01_9GLOM|nr:5599_t:CDS:2 [Diversispora eburnea]